VREGDWKLVMQNRKKPELYHIRQDRNEKSNLATQFPERVQNMKALHAERFSLK
jgi:arylsulfatase A-like enzyme